MMIAAGIIYAFTESTLEGKLILLVLFLASIFSWSVMVTKIRFLSFCKRQNDRFQDLFHQDRQPLRIFEAGVAFEGSNIFEIYEAGANELCFQMLGSIEVDESFASRLKTAEKITPAQMSAVQAAMERAVG